MCVTYINISYEINYSSSHLYARIEDKGKHCHQETTLTIRLYSSMFKGIVRTMGYVRARQIFTFTLNLYPMSPSDKAKKEAKTAVKAADKAVKVYQQTVKNEKRK